MPMTAAHPLAVLPLRRWRLDTTCLVIGSMSPDFEYFLRVELVSTVSHTLPGLFYFCIPITLLAAVVFHRVLKWPAIRVAPWRGRLAVFAQRPWPVQRWPWLVVSAALGAATHLVWDGFTHAGHFGPRDIAALRAVVQVPVVGDMLVHRVIQHVSTIVGLAVLAIVIARALRRVAPVELPAPPPRTYAIWVVSIAVGIALSALRIRGLALVDPGSIVVAILAGTLGGSLVASIVNRA
jgi:hypothetical protein